jgi:hypothetical protein
VETLMAKRAGMGAMPKILAVLALAAAISTGSRADEREFVITVGPIEGVDTFHAPQSIQQNMAQDASNVLFDEDMAAKKRKGFSLYLSLGTSAPVRGLWKYTAEDGTDWAMYLSSHVFGGYDGTSTTTFITGLDPDNDMDCAPGLGNLYCTNRSTHVFFFNGTSVTYLTNAPKGSLIDIYRNRLAIADVSGDQSSVFLSGHLNHSDWTVGTHSTSPVTWPIGGENDGGLRIRGMYSGYCDFLHILMDGQHWGLFGNDQRDFRVRNISTVVGCSNDKTIKETQGVLTWLSDLGVERFDCNVYQYPKISEEIRDKIDALNRLRGSELNWIQTTQADFEAGTLSEMSATLSPGSIVLSTWTATDTSGADFAAGTMVNVTTQVLTGSIRLSTTNVNVDNNSFETAGASADLAANWTRQTSVWERSSVDPYSGSWHLFTNDSSSYRLRIMNHNSGATLHDTGTIGPDGTWTQRSINLTSFIGQYIKIFITASIGSIESDPFYCSGGNLTWYSQGFGGGVTETYLDLFEGGKTSATTGEFTSQTWDTAISSPAWLSSPTSTAAWTTNNNFIRINVESSPDGATWTQHTWMNTNGVPFVQDPPGTSGGMPRQRYRRYKATMTLEVDSIGIPSIESVTFAARQSTGVWTSQNKNLGELTSFGNFEANYNLDGASMTFWVRTATSAAMLPSATWVKQTPFTTITAGTNPWMNEQIRTEISKSTQNPSLDNTTAFWNTGGARPPVHAETYQDRYHMFHSTFGDTDSYNAVVKVLQRNRRWTLFDGITAASSCLYRGDFLIGDSLSTGKIFRLYSGEDDAGAGISAYVHFKDYDADNEDAIKYFDRLYFTADHEAEVSQDVDLDISYTVDGATDTYSLGTLNLSESFGRINARIPFRHSSSNLNQGKWIAPKISNSGANEPFSLYGMRIYGKILDVE